MNTEEKIKLLLSLLSIIYWLVIDYLVVVLLMLFYIYIPKTHHNFVSGELVFYLLENRYRLIR